MPDESTYGFNIADATALAAMIGSVESEIPETRVGGGGGSIAYFYPPSGGVPAATYNTSTETLSTGSAVCTKASKTTTGIYTRGSTTSTVENITSFIVGASGRPMACALNTYGRWVVVVEDCGSSSTTGGGTTPNPDVGESRSSSRSVDMGYSLGV